MNAQAKAEFARIVVSSALEFVAKKWGVTVRQLCEQIAQDAQDGTMSGATAAFKSLVEEGQKALASGELHAFLRLA